MLNPCYVHGTTHVHGYVHACSCMFVHVKFWLPEIILLIFLVFLEKSCEDSLFGHDRVYIEDWMRRLVEK